MIKRIFFLTFKFIAIIMFLSICLNCKSTESSSKKSELKHHLLTELTPTITVKGKVESITLNENIYEIIIKDSLTIPYLILSKKMNTNDKCKRIEIGKSYNFLLTQLNNLHIKQTEFIINGKEIEMMPSLKLEDRIKFNGIEYSNAKGTLYEGKNLKSDLICE